MSKAVYDALSSVLGASMVSKVNNFIKLILEALDSALTNDNINVLLNVFIGVSISFLIIYFFIDLSSKASADMLTTERLILAFVKLFIGVAILLYLGDIIHYLFKIAYAIYNSISKDTFTSLQSKSGDSWTFLGYKKWPKYDKVSAELDAVYGSKVKTILLHFGTIILIIVEWLITWAAKLAAYFIAVSNAVNLIIRILFSPIAVVQCFDDLQRSAGIRYLKKIFATALTFAIIAGALYACQVITNNIVAQLLQDELNTMAITVDNIDDVIHSSAMIAACAVQIGAIGVMLTGGKLADDIVGVHP